SGPQHLARVLASDQAIVAQILKVANSAFYGFPGKIASIEKASALFGIDRLSQLLTNMSISNLPSKILKGYEMRSADLWQHALATAYGAKRVAETVFPEMAEDAYIAGLLHDSGKFILDACVFERKDRFKDHMTDTGCSFLEAERAILGFDHAEIAYTACTQWNIPEVIALAIRFHHNPSHPRSNLLAHLTHYANHLAIKTRIGACKNSLSLKLDRTTRKIFDLKDSELKTLLNTIRSDVNNTAQAVHT
ncbi:MAG TPA: HDOD domain-containing protein, partial [Desulfobacteria bacterium]|nr:HDOD domain-containing protein [Desulfobacteria bacterium]